MKNMRGISEVCFTPNNTQNRHSPNGSRFDVNGINFLDFLEARREVLDGYTSAIVAAVTEQETSTAEILRNVEQAASITRQIAKNVAGVMSRASETSRSSSQIERASSEVARADEVIE